MDSVNNVLNRIDDWSQPVHPQTGAAQGFAKRHLLTRVANPFITAPTELVAVAYNVLRTPVEAVGVVCKIGVKALSCISGAEALKKLDAKLPSLSDLLATVARVVKYAVGAISSLTLGFVSPSSNFDFHCNVLGLTVNRRKEAIKQAELDAAEKKRQEEEAKAKERLADLEVLEDLVGPLEELNKIQQDQEQAVEDAAFEQTAVLFDETQEDNSQEAEIKEEVSTVVGNIFDDEFFAEEQPASTGMRWAISTAVDGTKSAVKGTLNAAARVFHAGTFGYFRKEANV